MIRIFSFAAALASMALAWPALGEVTIGVSIGSTGPGSSLGVHLRNTFALLPKTLGGEPVKYVILDDASDPTNAAKNARKLVAEDRVDALMGSNTVPSALQMTQVAAEAKTPMITFTPAFGLTPERLRWTFVVPQPTELMMGAIAQHIKARKLRTVAYIGFSDAWGDIVYRAIDSHAAASGFTIVTNERYARADTSVTGQVLKIIAANPDAVVVGGSGTGAALPHIALVERGYKGPIYHNHGTVNAEFIKVGGAKVEGAIAATGPLMVPEELPADHPSKAISVDFIKRYEAAFGAGSRNAFAGYSHDGVALLNAAIPIAIKKAKPGTPEFREALRTALENVRNVVGTHGVYNLTPSNHNGVDERARVPVLVQSGAWRLLK
ncbi:MAG TPA: ABC transporter substrate-binding protein [Burkholderiales bacterium]|nr:ABC transporter substrate-binding protein [Burkholderiales bacterium]